MAENDPASGRQQAFETAGAIVMGIIVVLLLALVCMALGLVA